MPFSRRIFLKSAGMGLLALGLPPSFLLRAAEAERHARGRTLVVAFLRGGIDGLNVVLPFKERSYYTMRPSIAIPAPGTGEEKAIDLDGFYALHPALSPLKPLFEQGQFAIIHATGSPDNTRSHFDAQDYMETGTPGIKSTPDGWLNRYGKQRPAKGTPFQAVAVSQKMPRMCKGNFPVTTISSIEEFRLRDENLAPALQRIYQNSDDPLLRAGSDGLFRAMSLLRNLQAPAPRAAESYLRNPAAARLAEIARLIKADVGVEIAFTEIEGWDTHANQGGATGAMANRLRVLAEALAAFYKEIGDRLEDVLLVTLSEFGRTAKENGNRGTDHGHANFMFILGGKVRGGKVYGVWPGLEPELLNDGRDLALRTDFRAVCGEILARHLGQADLGKVFPGFRSSAPILQWKT